MGQLLLEDFTVLKVMLSAVVVGMIGVHLLRNAGVVDPDAPPTHYAANIIGGLIFGCGFALSAYCPGTGAAAIGQGNFDALAMAAGMIVGSYGFAEASGWIDRKLKPIGDRGRLTVYGLVPAARGTVVIVATIVFVSVLVACGLARGS